MKIHFCIIVKDDSELIDFKEAVESVLPYVDGWSVVANGKKTAEIEAYTRSQGGNYHYLAWDKDFSKQRNYLLANLPADTDYYFWLDSDDILIGGENLRDVAKIGLETGKDVLFFDYWYGCSFNGKPSKKTFVKVDITHSRERLLRPGTHVWKGRLHETPIPVKDIKDAYTKVEYKDVPIAVMHKKTMDDALKTMERNKVILEEQLADERKQGEADPRTLLYLMKIYVEEKDKEYWTKCLEMGEEYLKKSGWDEERATCCDIMAQAQSKLGNNQEAIKLLHDAIREYPYYPLLYLRLAQAYLLVNKRRQAKHWLEIGVRLPLDKKTAGITNLQEMKVLSAQVLLQLKFQEKDYEACTSAAEILLKEQPTEANEQQYLMLSDLKDLNQACKKTHELFNYLESIGEEKTVFKLLNTLPFGITGQPFAIKWRQKVTPPRVWEANEICYFANFGGEHFEKWDARNLSKGIGGSETAVIELSKEWTKRGYKVTIYGDPLQPVEIEGVRYLPWYHFNPADYFNIFIQWRSTGLSNIIKCKKYLVDMHDLFNEKNLEDYQHSVDMFMFKSKHHAGLAPNIKNKAVVPNGIRV